MDERVPDGADGPVEPDDGAGDAAVVEANARFYQALEVADLDLMATVWLHADHVLCAHPGRRALRGWDQVWASWRAILGSGGNPQVILTESTVDRRGTVAWVSAVENMLSGGNTGAAIALNVFELRQGRWLMVAHHSGPIAA